MIVNTQKKKTRFMNGNVDNDGVILDLLIDKHGSKNVFNCNFDTDNAVYSDGFIDAVRNGLVPELELHQSYEHKIDKEYHHVIIDDICYFVYFN